MILEWFQLRCFKKSYPRCFSAEESEELYGSRVLDYIKEAMTTSGLGDDLYLGDSCPEFKAEHDALMDDLFGVKDARCGVTEYIGKRNQTEDCLGDVVKVREARGDRVLLLSDVK